MKPRTRIILLSIISILIVVTIVLGVTYSFMKADIESSSVTEVSLKSCAKITLKDTDVSINLNNTYPMSKNKALQTTPYTFTVSSSCENYVGFNLYLATLNTNTLDASNIHYIITNNGSKDILAEGILSNATNAENEFSNEEKTQLNSGINGTYGSIYKLYNDSIPLQGEKSYDLYLYVDGDVTDASTMNKSFKAGIAVKSYDREAEGTFADLCRKNNSNTFACKIAMIYTTDGENGIYYHDGVGNYTNADQEAGDNSYRYSGADPNNYVCFGSDAATCPNEHLYRIIGVFDDNSDGEYNVKLIKADYTTGDMLGTDGRDYGGKYGIDFSHYKGSMDTSTIAAYRWNYDTSVSSLGSNNWTTSELNKINLNINYITYLSNLWSDMIEDTIWYLGGLTSNGNIAKSFYTGERNNAGYGSNPTTYGPENANGSSTKIGLMYVSDYGYAAYPDAWVTNLGSYSSSTIKQNNWLYMGLYEWTITPRSSYSDFVFFLHANGYLNSYYAVDGYSVRPVFYLKSSILYASGDGTKDSPFRVGV